MCIRDRDSIHATLLVLDGKVIGGDISSTELNGYMYPFTAIKDGLSEFPQTDSSTAETPVPVSYTHLIFLLADCVS